MKEFRTIVCVPCEDTRSTDLVPARELLDAHWRGFAAEEDARGDLFILSGVYKLIPAGQFITGYPYKLCADDVDRLTQVVVEQITLQGIGEICFYAKPEPAWTLHHRLLAEAVEHRIPVKGAKPRCVILRLRTWSGA